MSDLILENGIELSFLVQGMHDLCRHLEGLPPVPWEKVEEKTKNSWELCTKIGAWVIENNTEFPWEKLAADMYRAFSPENEYRAMDFKTRVLWMVLAKNLANLVDSNGDLDDWEPGKNMEYWLSYFQNQLPHQER